MATFHGHMSSPSVEVSQALTGLSAGSVAVATDMTSIHTRQITFVLNMYVIVKGGIISGLLYI
jgi:hypothetical protein